MKRRETATVITYETGHEDFLIDAIDKYDETAQEHVYEAWLYRESKCMKVRFDGFTVGAKCAYFEAFCACIKKYELDELYGLYDEFYGLYDKKVR